MKRLSFRGALGVLGLVSSVLVACDKKGGDKSGTDGPEPSKVSESAKPKEAPPKVEKSQEEGAPEADIRLIVLSEGELLGSEKAQVKSLVTVLKSKDEFSVDDRPATDTEKSFLDSVKWEKAGASAPKSWAKAQEVIALRILPPSKLESGKRGTEGRGDLFIFEPPTPEPLYMTQVELGPDRHMHGRRQLDGAELARWLKQDRRMRLKAAKTDEPDTEEK